MINTTAINGNAGTIGFTGKTITLNPQSQLLATAPVSKTAGDVNLTVTDTEYLRALLLVDFTSRAVAINLNGATIQGGNIALSATARDLSLTDEIPAYAQGFTGTVVGLLDQIPGFAVSALTGLAGVSAALGFDVAKVQSLLNGHITAAGSIAGGGDSMTAVLDGSDPKAVDLTNNTLFVPGHKFTTGEQVTYTAQDATLGSASPVDDTAIGGLTSGQTYYVLVVDPDHIQLADKPAIALDPTVTNAKATHTLTPYNALDFELGGIDPNARAVYLPGHGFNEGDLVSYTQGAGSDPLAGLTSGQTYLVHKIDDNNFQLLQPGSLSPVPLVQGTSTGTYTFTDFSPLSPGARTLTLALVDPASNTITIAGNGFSNGMTVTYVPLSSEDIGQLADGFSYTVQIVSANAFRFLDPTRQNAVVPLTVLAGQTVQELAFYGSPIPFTARTQTDANADTIQVPTQGLRTGQPVVYKTDPTISNNGTAHVRNADGSRGADIAVISNDTPIGGLTDNTVYYVTVVDANHVRLSASAADAFGVLRIPLTSLGGGNYHTLAAAPNTIRIGSNASLTSSDTGSASPSVGQSKDIVQRAVTATGSADALLDLLIAAIKSARNIKSPPRDANGAPVEGSDGLTGAGGLNINFANHTVQALAGSLATAAAPAVFSTPANIAIGATINQTTQSNVAALASKPDKTTGSAVAIAVAIGLYTNEADATLEANTLADTGSSLSVTTDVAYPILSDPAQVVLGVPAAFISNGIGELGTLLDGTLRLGSNILNTWVMTQAAPKGANSTSFNGSVAVNVYNNTSNARIAGGAKVNQTVASQNAGQGVSVTATTEMTMIDLAGIGNLGLNLAGAAGAQSSFDDARTAGASRTGGVGAALTGGGIIDVFGRSEGKSIGGSILVTALTNSTTAQIGDGAALFIGASGTLQVAATESILRIDIAQSGALSGGGALAFAGSGLGFRDRSTTIAGLADGPLGISITGGGALDIAATSGTGTDSTGLADASTDGVDVGVVGSIVKGEGGGSQIGVSVLVNDIVQTTEAELGTVPLAGSAAAAPGTNTNLQVGALSVNAETRGVLVGFGVAGAVSTAATPTPSGTDPLAGTSTPAQASPPSGSSTNSGIGIAGSALVNVGTDTTLGVINTSGTIATARTDVAATDARTVVLVSGGISIALKGAASSGAKAIAGAFALNQLTANTEALIRGATLSVSDTGADRPALTVTAARQGTLTAATAALAADTTATGKDFAGSVSINRIVDTTTALIDSATVTAPGASATVGATDSARILAIGGGFALTDGAVGVGGAIGFNQIAARTEASVTGTSRRSALTLSGLAIAAENDNVITAIRISGGLNLGASGDAAGAFTVGINIISTSPSVFDPTTADGIIATISNADVNATAAVSLLADDNSVIQSVAGALGIGGKASGFGVALSWNQVVLNIDATIDNATVTAASVSLKAETTQDAGLLTAKNAPPPRSARRVPAAARRRSASAARSTAWRTRSPPGSSMARWSRPRAATQLSPRPTRRPSTPWSAVPRWS